MKSNKLKITIELVPPSVLNQCLYQYFKQNDLKAKWRRIKEKLFDKNAANVGSTEKKDGQLEVHEIWEYDYENNLQLIRKKWEERS